MIRIMPYLMMVWAGTLLLAGAWIPALVLGGLTTIGIFIQADAEVKREAAAAAGAPFRRGPIGFMIELSLVVTTLALIAGTVNYILGELWLW